MACYFKQRNFQDPIKSKYFKEQHFVEAQLS